MDASALTMDTVRDPVCGMTVDPSAGKPRHEHAGRTYHFCSEGCRARFAAAPDEYIEATDPVCGMKVDRATARHMAKHEGRRFYFCSGRCKEKFEADPGSYLAGRPAPEPMPAGTIYTCPMHPEIEQVGPGDCPICGMALEPKGVPTRRGRPEPRARRLPPPLRGRRGADRAARSSSPWGRCSACRSGPGSASGPPAGLELVLATPVVLWCGWPFLVRGWKSFRTMNLNMFSLIAMGVVAA